MISALSSAVSGLNAATQRINLAATTIANADVTHVTNGAESSTPFVPSQVVQTNSPTGTANTTSQSVTPATSSDYNSGNTAGNSNGETQYPSVDVAHQLVQAKVASYNAQGNINVIKVQNNLFNSLLNIVS